MALLKRTEVWFIIRWLKRIAWIAAIYFGGSWLIAPAHLPILGLIAQMVLLMLMIVMQFVAMAMFLSRTRVETIYPGQAKSHTLDDYWGQPQIREIVEQWIALLKGVPKFRKLGGTLPTGVLLVGGPGTGKSYLARAIAGSAGLPFMSMDASSFTSMWMGMGALKIISFYRKAKSLAREYGGCIVFLDEIDAIARARSTGMQQVGRFVEKVVMGGMGSGTMELSTLLYELDGSMERGMLERLQSIIYGVLGKKMPGRDWVVFTMAATNVPEAVDKALTRAGRLDRRIIVNEPDREGRREIILGYLNRIKAAPNVDANIEALVDEMQSMTPAEIWRAVTTEGPRKAVFAGHDEVTFADIQHALRELQVGLRTPIRGISEDEKTAVAVHESGHAVLVWLLTTHRLSNVTIVRYEGALGHVLHHPDREQYLRSLKDFWYDLIISLGGRAGEIIRFGAPLASVGGDYHHAIHVARTLLEQGLWGTPIATDKEFSDRVRVLFEEGLREAKRLLGEYVELHTKLVDKLVLSGEIGHEEVTDLWGPRPWIAVPLPDAPPGLIRASRPRKRRSNGST